MSILAQPETLLSNQWQAYNPPKYALDFLSTTATAAYSVRLLRGTYAGPCMNVRRSSDNTTLDIGFTVSGDLDAVALNTFIGSGSGFIHTWYDQSGHGHHAIQATAANQPQIVLGVTTAGRPSAQSSAGTAGLSTTIPAATLPLTMSVVVERTGNLGAFNVPISQGSGFPCIFHDANAGNIGVANDGVDGLVGAAADNLFHAAIAINNGGSSSITIDGTQTLGTISQHPGATNLYLMSSNLTEGLFGNLSEAIYFEGALTAGDIATLNSSQTIYYNTVGAATFMTNSIGTVSSLDTGNVGTFTAWGGSEYGYAYTYTLTGTVPTGVAIDPDMGTLSFASPVAAGTYTFGIIARNRENASLAATFPYTLTVAQGVTSGRTGTQILHTTYAPDSGTWGTPTAGDWTAVLHAMVTQIISDQTAAGDGLLHATIVLRRGTQYNYTDNAWMNGIQYFVLRDDPAFPTGAIPALCNTYSVAHDFDSKYQIINAGTGSAMLHQADGIKNKSAQIQTVNVGSTNVTLVNSSDASRLNIGRWHVVLGQQTQLGGYPPNPAWVDYVKVLSVSGTLVTLDRPLKYYYDRNWFEDPGNNPDQNFGGGYIVPWDIGGSGGTVPTDGRTAIRSYWLNLNFVKNPNITGSTENVVSHQSYIDLTMEGCALLIFSPTMLKHLNIKNCTLTMQSEPDKIAETILFDGCTTAAIGGATGFMYFLSRNTLHGAFQISPRQFRMLGGTMDATQGELPGVVFSVAFNGPMMYFDFESVTFKRSHYGGQWSWAGNLPNTTRATLGVDAQWLGSQLQIPYTSAQFAPWVASVFEGMIITESLPPIDGTSWGYVDSMTMSTGGNDLLLNIIWVNGTRPTLGVVYGGGRWRRLRLANCTLDPTSPPGALAPGPTYWESPGFMAEDSGGLSNPGGPTYGPVPASAWTFPTGYPNVFHQFPVTPAGPCLLDTIPGATAAYSLRRLRRGFLGAPINVRRSSDNTTQDIRFLGDVMDPTMFAAFVGSATAYVTKWYDQIGSQDAVQATNANQPTLVINVPGLTDTGAGSGKPTVTSAGGAGIVLAATLAANSPAAVTLAMVCGRTGLQTSFNVPFGLTGGTGGDNKPGLRFDNHLNGGIGIADLNTDVVLYATADGVFHAATGISHGASSKVVVDSFDTIHGGTATGTLVSNSGATTINIMSDAGASGFSGNLAEAIYFNSVLSDPNITALQADQNTYYVHIPLVADAIPGAMAGYSTRRVSENHPNTAPCIRLQRSSDNAQLDIGFDPATRRNFDHATYAAWAAGGGTISVVKWYDQVGTADMIPMDSTNPPTFVDAITPNGQPAIFNNGAVFSGFSAAIPAENTPLTMSVVCNRTGGIVGTTGVAGNIVMAFYGGPPADASHMPGLIYMPGGGNGMVVTELRYSASVALPCPDNIFVSAVGRSNGGETRMDIDGQVADGSTGSRVGAVTLNLFGAIAGEGEDQSIFCPYALTGYIAEALYHFGSITDAQVVYLRTTDISGFGTRTSNLLLDYVTGPVAAYGLRQLRTAYAGAAVNVRRSSDNARLDIGFNSSGDFDSVAFNTFVGAGTGFVVTWYDQSGNNAHATQATPANQPQITLNTSGFTFHNRAAIQFLSTTATLVATVPAATIPLSIVAEVARSTVTGQDNICGLGSGAPQLFWENTFNGGIAVGNLGIDSIVGTNVSEPYYHCTQGIVNGASSQILINGGPTLGTLSSHAGSTTFTIGGVIGYIPEVYYYPRAFIQGEFDAVQQNLSAYF